MKIVYYALKHNQIGAASGAVGAVVNGGNIFKGAAIVAFSSAISHGIGNSYVGVAGSKFAKKLRFGSGDVFTHHTLTY